MKNQRDKLHQYQKKITIITSRETAIAKEHLRNGDKTRALLALRRKKYQESILAKTDQQLAQLEALTSDVEFALVQKDVVFGLQQGTAVLKEIHKEMGDINKVEKLIGEGEEERAFQREVSEMLSGRMTAQEEDEVEDELAALEAETNGATKNVDKLPTAPDGITVQPRLPNTPAHVPARTETTKQERQSEPMAA